MRDVELETDGNQDVLVVLNPLQDAVGEYSQEMQEFAEEYDGKTVRVTNPAYVSELPGEDELYDESYVMTENGLRDQEADQLMDMADRVEFAGASLDDLGEIYGDFSPLMVLRGYRIVEDKMFEGEPPRPEEIVTESDMNRVSELLEEDEETVQKRFEEYGLEGLLDAARTAS